MDDQRRFSVAPVNFDRFVSLNRSHSRSLSPDNELHQMLRPYEIRLTAATTGTSSSTGGGHGSGSNWYHHRKSTRPSPLHVLHKADRRSTDIVVKTSSGVAMVEGVSTQAAAPPSRSVSGGAATTTSAGTPLDLTGATEARVGPLYHNVEDETAELECSQFVAEDVDLLLRAVQQLGTPLYNPVVKQFVCWNMHALVKRSRASYGDIEGVCCDFCGDTDWLDSLVEEEEGKETSSQEKKIDGKGQQSEIVKEDKDDAHAGIPAQSRYLYHCPVCKVDICCACLDEVRADERFHVPCLQCQRCGAYETRQQAPLHQCSRQINTKNEAIVQKEEVGRNGRQSWIPPSLPFKVTTASTLSVASKEPPVGAAEVQPLPKKYVGATAVRSHVRLGLSRRHGGALVATAEPINATTPVMVLDEEPVDAHTPIKALKSTEPSFLPCFSNAVATPIPEASASTRKRAYTTHGTTTIKFAARPKLEDPSGGDEGGDLPVELTPPLPPQQQQQQLKRRQSALPFCSGRVLTQVSYTAVSTNAEEALQQQQSAVLSTARYEVHMTPQSSDEVEEVQRISREQRLLLFPAPSLGRVTVAYFPTRLGAESCVDRATVGAVEAVLKRHVHNL